MSVLRIGCLGVVVEMIAEDSPAALSAREWLASDFARFAHPPADMEAREARIELRILGPAPLPSRGLPLLRANGATAYGWGERRVCDYGARGWVVSRRVAGRRLIEVASEDAGDLIELAYLALLSSLGEELDAVGFHRLHALGFEWKGRASLLTLDSGGGKSSLAYLLSKRSGARIHSDESPLLERSSHAVRMHPFPVRMAFRPEVARRLGVSEAAGDQRVFRRRLHGEKILLDLPTECVATGPSTVVRLFIGATGFSRPRIKPISAVKIAGALAGPLVAGLGLAQMAEHMLRPAASPRLAWIAVSRARLALELARQAEGYRFELGPDPMANLDALLEASSDS